MNHVDRDRINSYMYRYSIKDVAENFNKLAEVIYRTILYIIDNYRIIKQDSKGITVEICLDEHRQLLEDLTKNFFMKKN